MAPGFPLNPYQKIDRSLAHGMEGPRIEIISRKGGHSLRV